MRLMRTWEALWAGAQLRHANRWQALGACLSILAPMLMPLAGPDARGWLDPLVGLVLAYWFVAGNLALGLGRRQDAPAPAPDGEPIELSPESYGLLTQLPWGPSRQLPPSPSS